MRMLAYILLASCAACGCLSVVRVPLPSHRYDSDGNVVETRWNSFCDDVKGMRVYPTVKMRCRVTAALWRDAVSGAAPCRAGKWARWIPVSAIWLTSPADACIDTVFLPYDLYRRRD